MPLKFLFGCILARLLIMFSALFFAVSLSKVRKELVTIFRFFVANILRFVLSHVFVVEILLLTNLMSVVSPEPSCKITSSAPFLLSSSKRNCVISSCFILFLALAIVYLVLQVLQVSLAWAPPFRNLLRGVLGYFP